MTVQPTGGAEGVSLTQLYLPKGALLFTHEIDSAYWKEWELLSPPGGIPLFLVLNCCLIVIVVRGLRWVVLGDARGRCSWLVLAGSLAVSTRGTFLLTAHPQFRLPAPLIVLGAILFTIVAWACPREDGGRRSRPVRSLAGYLV